MAVPTTSGSGSEVTPFATIWDFKNKKKYSLCSKLIRPKQAILDYKLTMYLPKEITLYTGLDSISHCFESIWNKNANKKTISIATYSLKIALDALPKIMKNLENFEARRNMQISSCLAGIAISTTKTALAHSISYAFTTNYKVPHGLACSFTLPEILLFNSEKDDGRLLNLAKNLGFENSLFLYKKFNQFLEDLNIFGILSKFSSNFNEIKDINYQMFNKGKYLII